MNKDFNCINDPSMFDNISIPAQDPVIGIMMKEKKCSNPNKVNLSAGAYRDDELKNYLFKTVRKAEEETIQDPHVTRQYMPPLGDRELCYESRKLFFDDDHELVKSNRILSVQSFSGTGALRLNIEFIKIFAKKDVCLYMPNPCWGNLVGLYDGINMKKYEYLDSKTQGVNFDVVKKTLEDAQDCSIFLMHTCAFNPCGCDMSLDQWKIVASIAKQKKHFLIMDTAYPGFASGIIQEDIKPIHILVESNVELAICQSYSKNMGLYGERAGVLHYVFADQGGPNQNKQLQERMRHFLSETVHSFWLTPVNYGAQIIKRTLLSQRKEWEEELLDVVGRLHRVRKLLYDELNRIECPGKWEHIIKQIGMFVYTGLNEKECEYLIERKNIFVLMTGRLSLCQLTNKNTPLVAKCIKEAILYAK